MAKLTTSTVDAGEVSERANRENAAIALSRDSLLGMHNIELTVLGALSRGEIVRIIELREEPGFGGITVTKRYATSLAVEASFIVLDNDQSMVIIVKASSQRLCTLARVPVSTSGPSAKRIVTSLQACKRNQDARWSPIR
jgi:hypothetical protein